MIQYIQGAVLVLLGTYSKCITVAVDTSQNEMYASHTQLV